MNHLTTVLLNRSAESILDSMRDFRNINGYSEPKPKNLLIKNTVHYQGPKVLDKYCQPCYLNFVTWHSIGFI